MSRKLPGLLRATPFLILMQALPAAASTSTSAAAPDLFDHVYDVSAEDVRAYWTPERLARTPDKGDVAIKPPGNDPLETDGDAWQGTGPLPAGVGRLFFVTATGAESSCTATAVSARRPDILVTAAHCVGQSTTELSSMLLFAPAFHKSIAPLGVFAVKRLVAPVMSGEFEPDVAFLQVHPDTRGRYIADVAGVQRIDFDNPPWRGPRIKFGYPVSANGFGLLPPPAPYDYGNPEYSGQVLAYCATTQRTVKECRGFSGEQAGWGLTCVQGPGSSGGPQLTGFNFDTGQGTVIGVHSHGAIVDGRATSCAAHLGDASRRAFDYLQRINVGGVARPSQPPSRPTTPLRRAQPAKASPKPAGPARPAKAGRP